MLQALRPTDTPPRRSAPLTLRSIAAMLTLTLAVVITIGYLLLPV